MLDVFRWCYSGWTGDSTTTPESGEGTGASTTDSGLERSRYKIAAVSIGGGTVLLVLFGSVLVANAVILAVVTSAGLLFIANKFPTFLKNLLLRFNLLTDITAAVLTYVIFGSNVTSLLAAGIVGCITSIVLWGLQITTEGYNLKVGIA